MKTGILHRFGRLFTLPLRVARGLEAVTLSLETLSSRVSVLEEQLRSAEGQTKTDYEELKRDIVERLARIEAHNVEAAKEFDELRGELTIMRSPDAVKPAQRLIALILQHGKPLPDDIHEHALRLELRDRPFDPQLTYSLVALMVTTGSPPMPDSKTLPADTAARPKGSSTDDLLRLANERALADDTIGVYAALWQIVVRGPSRLRGWSEFARAFAERNDWANCRLALQHAFDSGEAPDKASADAILYALSELASHQRLDTLAWNTWVEGLPEELQGSPYLVDLLSSTGGERRAAELLPLVIQRESQNAMAWLAASTLSFHQGQFAESYDHLRRALDLNFPGMVHLIMRHLGAQIMGLVNETGKADELTDLVSERTRHYANLNVVPPKPSPESLISSQRLRRVAMERGLPSASLITIGKSASVSVGNILSSGFHLAPVMNSMLNYRVIEPWAKDFAEGGGIQVSHLAALPRNVDTLASLGNSNIIVHVRDPRQVLYSYVEHGRRYPKEVTPAEREAFSGNDESAIDFALDFRYMYFVDWIARWVEAETKLNVHFTTFEDFTRDRAAFVDRLLGLYGGDTSFFDRNAALSEIDGVDYHRRLGSIDEWRGQFNARQTERVNGMMPGHFWEKFNWTP